MGTRFLPAAIAAGLLAAAGAAHADLVFGNTARSAAMGGAGIAIVDRNDWTDPVNPASLALQNRRVATGWPGIGLRAHGVPIDKAYNHLLVHPSQNDAVGLARDFGKRGSDYGATLSWGIRFGHLTATAFGVATARVVPNTALESWANTANGNITLLTGNERADILGAAVYSLPTIGVAERVSPAGSPIRIEAGARIKLMRAIYSHYIVSAANIANNTAAAPAPELNGGTSLTKDGVGLDVGMLIHPASHQGISGAVVMTNAFEPDFRFNGTDVNGAPVRYNLQPRSVTAGSAWQSGRSLVVADVVDMTRAYGDVQARFGGEYASRHWAFRAGYVSARGFTVGIGYRGFDIAYGGTAPLQVSEFLRF